MNLSGLEKNNKIVKTNIFLEEKKQPGIFFKKKKVFWNTLNWNQISTKFCDLDYCAPWSPRQ